MKKATTKKASVEGHKARKGAVIKKAPRTIGKKASFSRGSTRSPEVNLAPISGMAPIRG